MSRRYFELFFLSSDLENIVSEEKEEEKEGERDRVRRV